MMCLWGKERTNEYDQQKGGMSLLNVFRSFKDDTEKNYRLMKPARTQMHFYRFQKNMKSLSCKRQKHGSFYQLSTPIRSAPTPFFAKISFISSTIGLLPHKYTSAFSKWNESI
jgi:hypothetical protein